MICCACSVTEFSRCEAAWSVFCSERECGPKSPLPPFPSHSRVPGLFTRGSSAAQTEKQIHGQTTKDLRFCQAGISASAHGLREALRKVFSFSPFPWGLGLSPFHTCLLPAMGRSVCIWAPCQSSCGSGWKTWEELPVTGLSGGRGLRTHPPTFISGAPKITLPPSDPLEALEEPRKAIILTIMT